MGQRYIVGFVLLLVIGGILVMVLDWREVQRLMGNANWNLIPVSLLFVAISYICLSYNFTIIYRIFGVRSRQRDLLEISFISTALGHLVSTAGTAGHSVRYLLLRRQGVLAEDILAPALFQSYFNNLALASLLPLGLGYILAIHRLSQNQSAGIGVAVLVLLLVVILSTILLFVRSMRRALLNRIVAAWRLIAHRDVSAFAENFHTTLEKGVTTAMRRPAVMLLALSLILADWSASITALWFTFDALNDPISLGVLITGFAIGVTIGLLSLVPGGLGIQEGSMAGVYALLGVPFEQAVLAAILFRVLYYFVPFTISLLFYWRLLRQPSVASE